MQALSKIPLETLRDFRAFSRPRGGMVYTKDLITHQAISMRFHFRPQSLIPAAVADDSLSTCIQPFSAVSG